MVEVIENTTEKKEEISTDEEVNNFADLFKDYKGETKQPEYWKDIKPVGKEEI